MSQVPTDIEISAMISELRGDHETLVKMLCGNIIRSDIKTSAGNAADMLSAILHGRSQVKSCARCSYIISDEKLEEAGIRRFDLNQWVVKVGCGYANGSTVNYCLESLGLIKVGRGSKVLGLSQMGRDYLQALMADAVKIAR